MHLRFANTATRAAKAGGLAIAALLGACVHPPLDFSHHTFTITSPFDAALATSLLGGGPNTLTGNAFMRQRGGGVVTCAGSVVTLLPSTPYTKDRMLALYGAPNQGVALLTGSASFDPDPPLYKQLIHSTKCDSQGNFAFPGEADGEFFVVVTVQWTVGYRVEGGHLMQAVHLAGGTHKRIVLSP